MKMSEWKNLGEGIEILQKDLFENPPKRYTLKDFLKNEWVVRTIALLTRLATIVGIPKFLEYMDKIYRSLSRKKGAEGEFKEFVTVFRAIGKDEDIFTSKLLANPGKTEKGVIKRLTKYAGDIVGEYGPIAVLFMIYCSLRLAERRGLKKAGLAVDVFERGILFAYSSEIKAAFDRTATAFVKARPKTGFIATLLSRF